MNYPVSEELVESWSRPLVIHCEKGVAIVLIREVMLALRIPHNTGEGAKVALSFARELALGLIDDAELMIPQQLREEWDRELFGRQALT